MKVKQGVAKVWVVLLFLGLGVCEAAGEGNLSFNRDIRPLLAEYCFECHGNDAKTRKGKLRLDVRGGALKDLGGHAAIVAGDSEKSKAYELIVSSDEDEIMPPRKTGKKMTADEAALIKRWIDEGAAYEKHWSFVPPVRGKLPAVKDMEWVRNAIDRYVLAKLEAKGLKGSEKADRYTLIRRVYLDLTGLPPAPKEVDAFVNDKSKRAYEKLVDGLLKSPRYGERWASMWLDLARYSDSMGYEKDLPRTIWAYRDWVIDAYNRDLPFDQFTVQQLAGDMLRGGDGSELLATAFHRNTLTNEEGGTDNEEFRVAAVKDRVNTTMQVWMGMTMGCANCHSHKYDPISHEDYYRFFAVFNQTADADRGDDQPKVTTLTPSQRVEVMRLRAEVAKLKGGIDLGTPEARLARARWEALLKVGRIWRTVRPVEVKSVGGAKLTVQKDGGVLASGKSPAKDTYVVRGKLGAGVYRAVRLEAMKDKAMRHGGPGRNARDPNFVINEFVVEVREGGKGAWRKVKIKDVKADFSQKNWHVKGAIDGKAKTGWAVSPRNREAHAAVFYLDKAVEIRRGGEIRVTMVQHYGNRLVMGKFRISVTGREGSNLAFSDVLGDAARVAAGKRSAAQRKLLENGFMKQWGPVKEIYGKISGLEKRIGVIEKEAPVTPIMRELVDGKRRVTYVHERGNFLKKGKKVEAGVPGAFGVKLNGQANRLSVARWLVSKNNPLTARVQVNRVWARLFGRGFVLTEGDFGIQGMAPTHLGLLDWLAVEYRENGWSQKKLLKTILMSATYRQSAVVNQDALKVDGKNELLAYAPRFRLEGEIVRDQALAIGGRLSGKMYGASVMPPQPAGIWRITYSRLKWKAAVGEDRYRRGLYTYWRRTSPYPSMLIFDGGTRETCVVRRVRTNTPLQAMVTMNDPVFLEAAGGLAERMMKEGGGTVGERVGYGLRLAVTRKGDKDEVARLVSLMEKARGYYAKKVGEARELLKVARIKGRGNDEADTELAGYVIVGNVLLNLDEVLMK